MPNGESIRELYNEDASDEPENEENEVEPTPTYAGVASSNNNNEYDEDEVLNTFSNMTGRILGDLLNIPHSADNPVEFDNTRYYIDASNSQIIFEGFMRNSFR